MNDLVNEKTITLPKIPVAYWKAIVICSIGALGLALVADLTFKELVGTMLIFNSIGAGITMMSLFLES